jgi:hypothetical protein
MADGPKPFEISTPSVTAPPVRNIFISGGKYFLTSPSAYSDEMQLLKELDDASRDTS